MVPPNISRAAATADSTAEDVSSAQQANPKSASRLKPVIELFNAEHWARLAAVPNEIEINKGGRRMTPELSFAVSGLHQVEPYELCVVFLPIGKHCLFYNDDGVWSESPVAASEAANPVYKHPLGAIPGEQWMAGYIRCSDMRLTNSPVHTTKVLLQPNRQYQPVIMFIGSGNPEPLALPELRFIAVLSFHSPFFRGIKQHEAFTRRQKKRMKRSSGASDLSDEGQNSRSPLQDSQLHEACGSQEQQRFQGHGTAREPQVSANRVPLLHSTSQFSLIDYSSLQPSPEASGPLNSTGTLLPLAIISEVSEKDVYCRAARTDIFPGGPSPPMSPDCLLRNITGLHTPTTSLIPRPCDAFLAIGETSIVSKDEPHVPQSVPMIAADQPLSFHVSENWSFGTSEVSQHGFMTYSPSLSPVDWNPSPLSPATLLSQATGMALPNELLASNETTLKLGLNTSYEVPQVNLGQCKSQCRPLQPDEYPFVQDSSSSAFLEADHCSERAASYETMYVQPRDALSASNSDTFFRDMLLRPSGYWFPYASDSTVTSLRDSCLLDLH